MEISTGTEARRSDLENVARVVEWKTLSVTAIAAENPSVFEYISTLERRAGREDALSTVLESILRAEYQKWDKGLDNAEEFVRWSKSIAAHALRQSHTVECIDASGRCTITGEV